MGMRIREYGSSQMERLREQYKIQQQHLVKLLEIMDIGNCLTVIEAECLHTESMIFDPDFNLDFALHPVHIPREGFGDSGSEYETASNTSRRPSAMQDEDLITDFPDPDLPDLPDLPDISEITADLYADNVMLDVTSANGLPTVIIKTPKTTPHKPHKRHRRRHRSEGDAERHSSQENLADLTSDAQPRKRKHRKHKHRRKEATKADPGADAEKTAKKSSRSRNKSAKSVDGNIPETKNKAHVMNISLNENILEHVNDDTVNDGDVSEYASAAQSREQTPKVENVTPVGHATGSGADHVILRMENDAEHQKLTMQHEESSV